MRRIEHNAFSTEEEALGIVRAKGMTPVVLDRPAFEMSDHWHDFDSLLFIVSGELEMTDSETGVAEICRAGTLIRGRAGYLHREKSTGFRGVFGFDRDPSTFSLPIAKPPPVRMA